MIFYSIALNDLFTSLKVTGKYQGPTYRKIDVNMDNKQFETNLKAEIAELSNINIRKAELINNLDIIILAASVN